MQTIVENQGLLGLGLVALLALGVAGYYFWRQNLASQHQRHVATVIQGLGVDYLRDVVIPDGIDGLAFIDYLLLTPKGLIVLDIKHQDGVLFGGVAVDQWTQVISGKTYKFPNPLYLNQNHRQAVEWNTKDIDVFGQVVFSNAGQFPKGIPEGCSMIDELATDLSLLLDSGNAVNPVIQQAWQRLRELSITTRASLGRHHSAVA